MSEFINGILFGALVVVAYLQVRSMKALEKTNSDSNETLDKISSSHNSIVQGLQLLEMKVQDINTKFEMRGFK